MTDLSIIVPVYNEASSIPTLYQRIKNVLINLACSYEIIFVNDGSRDTSLTLIKDLATYNPEVKFIDFSRNFGHQIAVSAGLEFSSGARIVIIDADLQDPPEMIASMYEKMSEGWNVVYARRVQRKGENFLKLLTAKVFYRLLKGLTSTHIPVDTGDFRMIDRKVANAVLQMPERHKFLRGMISWVGFKQTYLEYVRDSRYAGRSGYSFRKMIRFAMDGITGFSNLPLKMATVFGFIFSAIAFLLILYTLYARFFSNDYVQGWASIMISILFIGGVQLICVGLIGEYLIRMDANLKQRPLFIINETNIRK